MSNNNNNSNSFSLRSALEKEKLKGPNFLEWYRNIRIVLMNEKREYVLDTPLPEKPRNGAPTDAKAKWEKHEDDARNAYCLMLITMNSELQKRFENTKSPIEIIETLKTMFQEQARTERYQTVKSLFECKMSRDSPVSPHVLKMMGYLDNLEKLDHPISQELAVDIVLQSLPSSFDQFVMNFNLRDKSTTLQELHGMLKTAEPKIKKAGPDVLMVQKGKGFKKSGKGKKSKTVQAPSQNRSESSSKPKRKPSSTDVCLFCKKPGHWRRDCIEFKEGLKKLEASYETNNKGIYVIEINANSTGSNSWVLDTGCGAHICTNVQGLRNSRTLKKGQVELRVGNGARVAAKAVGEYHLSLPSGMILILNNCYYVPAISRNIISISVLDLDGFDFSIKNKCCTFSRDNLYYGSAPLENGLYILNQSLPVYNINTKRFKANDSNPSYLWHCRLGHINEKRIQRLHKAKLLDSFDFESFEKCESCLLGKMTRAPFNKFNERATELLGLIHTDVCGPMSVSARGNYKYFITFTDDFSRYGYVYLMRHKSECFEKFKEFQNEVQNQLGKSIKYLRSDRGGEYLSQEFDDHLKECGIVSQLTAPGTPQWNGVSERRNRTLLDMVRSMMSHVNLPLSFWGYALETAAFTLNRVPTKSAEKTPYEMWTGKKPSLSFLKIWGCEAYVKKLISDKLTPKSDKCYFVGYPKETIAYFFYNQSENKVFIARDCVFLEREFLSKKDSGSRVQLEEIREIQESVQPEPQEEQQLDSHEVEEPTPVVPETTVVPESTAVPETTVVKEVRRSGRTRNEVERYGFLVTHCHDLLIVDSDEPSNHKEAMLSPDSDKWQMAENSEMESMSINQVWTLEDLPPGAKAIECKWVYKKKIDVDGNVQMYKARLVAKGFKQVHGVDYDETYSPVAMLKSIRILLGTAAYYDYEIWQMDVKTAFLNGILEEDVYMVQPEGFVDPKNPKKVCKLHRSIYGLKQASRSWNLRFDEAIKEFGFIRNEEEHCVYKKASGSAVTFLILYVDDILLLGNDIPLLQSVKTWLGGCFSMKDMGDAAYILGIRIYRDRLKRIIGLCQDAYIDKILHRFNMQNSKNGFLPMSHGVALSRKQCPSTAAEEERMSRIPYASAIGSIMYAMLCTRPDVACALSMVSRYQSNPGESHWTAVKGILKYLKNTKDKFLIYGGCDELRVSGHVDASFQTDRDDFRSQSGYVFCLNGGAVSWKSSKQSTVADSTTEAEYIAASEAAKEAVWIKKFVTELGVIPSISEPISLLCDNTGAIVQAKEPRSHQKSKHIERKYHVIREIIKRGDVVIDKVATEDNVADPLTKALPRPKHESHAAGIGIRFLKE